MITLRLVFIFSFFIHSFVYSQINNDLKARLDSIYRLDQLYRKIMDSPQKKDSLRQVHLFSENELEQFIFQQMRTIDSSNMNYIKTIINEYGYPGVSLVGSPTNLAAWYVIQHSANIALYFPLIEQAGKNKELPFKFVATMQDRLLMSEGKEQRYGTQVLCEPIRNEQTGKELLESIHTTVSFKGL